MTSPRIQLPRLLRHCIRRQRLSDLSFLRDHCGPAHPKPTAPQILSLSPNAFPIPTRTAYSVVAPFVTPTARDLPPFPTSLHSALAALDRIPSSDPATPLGIYGHGYGGALALSIAITEPRISAVAVVDPITNWSHYDVFGDVGWLDPDGPWINMEDSPTSEELCELRAHITSDNPVLRVDKWHDQFLSPNFFFYGLPFELDRNVESEMHENRLKVKRAVRKKKAHLGNYAEIRRNLRIYVGVTGSAIGPVREMCDDFVKAARMSIFKREIYDGTDNLVAQDAASWDAVIEHGVHGWRPAEWLLDELDERMQTIDENEARNLSRMSEFKDLDALQRGSKELDDGSGRIEPSTDLDLDLDESEDVGDFRLESDIYRQRDRITE